MTQTVITTNWHSSLSHLSPTGTSVHPNSTSVSIRSTSCASPCISCRFYVISQISSLSIAWSISYLSITQFLYVHVHSKNIVHTAHCLVNSLSQDFQISICQTFLGRSIAHYSTTAYRPPDQNVKPSELLPPASVIHPSRPPSHFSHLLDSPPLLE